VLVKGPDKGTLN